jgi:hypothetical protein
VFFIIVTKELIKADVKTFFSSLENPPHSVAIKIPEPLFLYYIPRIGRGVRGRVGILV